MRLLQQSDLEVRNLIDGIEEERTFVIECVRYLLEEGIIYYKSPTVLSLKKKE